MKKIICLLIAALMLSSFVCAQMSDELYSEIEERVKSVIGRRIPMYGNEKVNVYLVNGTVLGHAVSSEGIFRRIGRREIGNETMKIYVEDEKVIKEILAANNSLDKFYELKGEDRIKINPVGFGKSVKYFFTNIFGKVASWFS